MSEIKQVTNFPETFDIGGNVVNLRWTKRALFWLNTQPQAEGYGPFAHLCCFVWAMAKAEEANDTPFSSPEDVADALDPSDDKLLARVEALVMQGNKAMGVGGDPDPLSENGPLPETGSD